MTPTLSSSAFIVELKGVNVPAGGPAEFRELYVDYDPYYGTICVVDVECDYCTVSGECATYDYKTPALLVSRCRLYSLLAKL